MKKQQKKGYILIAVSSEEQAKTEKASLKEQERIGREFLEKHDIRLEKVMSIPGHSRYESDLPKMLDEFREKGITAYDDLANIWRSGALQPGDVLVIYADSRAARSKTGVTWILENWLRHRGRVYSVLGGNWIDEENEDFGIAMSSINATHSVKYLVKSRPHGMWQRALEGKRVGSKLPYYHREPRDAKGKTLPLIVDREKYQAEIDALFDEVVNRHTSWAQLEDAMFARGFRYTDGGPFPYKHYFNCVRTPAFWGHIALRVRSRSLLGERVDKFELWSVDEAEKHNVPPEVKIAYNVCEGVYSGEQRELFLNEVRISLQNGRGRVKRGGRYAFSGLILCHECGNKLAHIRTSQSGYHGFRCNVAAGSHKSKNVHGIHCSQKRSITYETIENWLTPRLNRLVEGDLSDFLQPSSALETKRKNALLRDLKKLNRGIENTAASIADAPPITRPEIYKQLQSLIEQRDAVQKEVDVYEGKAVSQEERITALEFVRKSIVEIGGVHELWNQAEDDRFRILTMVMGSMRMVGYEREIIGTVYV